jgi:hypothetical protein
MALKREDCLDDAQQIGCEVEAVMAVAAVESRGGGFDPEGFPKTLFEGQWFYKFTKGKFAESHPNLCFPKWDKKSYGKTWQEEKARLATACTLDRTAALMSASWGMFQIMGFNFATCGFKTVQQYVSAVCKDENEQLAAFTQFIIHSRLDDELREKRWADFARLYNGSGYAQNQYDVKLAKAYEQAKKQA